MIPRLFTFSVLLLSASLTHAADPSVIRIIDPSHLVTVSRVGDELVIRVPATASATSVETADVKSAVAAGPASTNSPTVATVAGSKKSPKAMLDSIDFDRPIGGVPAFSSLGLTPETVSEPSTPRDLAAALLNGVDRHGVLQTGIAIETAPFRVFHVIPTDIESYRDEYWDRLLYNFSFSLATAKASDKSQAMQLALGFSTILYQDQESDPRRNSDLKAAFDRVNLEHPMTGSRPGTAVPDEDPEAKTSLQEAANAFRDRAWAGTIWSISASPTWSSTSGNATDLGNAGFTAWSTFSYGLQNPVIGDQIRLQFLAEARYRKNELVVDPDDKSHSTIEDSFVAAGRLRLGTTDFNAFGEGGYVVEWRGFNGSGSGVRAAGGIEKRVAPNMWLVLSAGQQFGSSTDKSNELFAIGSIRIGSADTPQFSPASTGN